MPVHDLYDIKGLFCSIANGDEVAFRTIFDLYKKRVFATGLKMLKSETEAEEIVQDVFLSVWIAKARLGNINHPEGYLFTIVYNTIYTHLKKASRDKMLLNTIIRHLTDTQNATEEIIAGNETRNVISQAINELSPQQRTVYQLSKQEGLSYEDIADRMNISRNTVRNHLAEAMKTIRAFLKKTDILLMSLLIFFTR